MTKKHFKAIAETLAAAQPIAVTGEEIMVWRALVRDFADMCARFNPNFDRSRFYEACGYAD